MAEPSINASVVRFGIFELDRRSGELRRSGIKVKLQDQPFQILTMLLERPGEIVTREELQKRLWPGDTFVDFDLSLNSAVKKLRQALGDDSDNPRYIETLYRRGYRFIGAVNGAHAEEPLAATRASAASPQQVVKPEIRGSRALTWSLLAALCVAGAAWIWWTRPLPTPQVTGYTQITHDDLRKGTIVTDGERLFFSEMSGDRFVVSQVSAAGGETSILPIPFKNVGLGDIAPDGTALLVGSMENTGKTAAFWAVPLPVGPPQRLNDAAGNDAAWSRDRNQIAFASGADIYVANGNGSQPRKIATGDGSVFGLRFSPDGRVLRFEVVDPRNGSSALWQVRLDGTSLHPLLPGWNQTPHECCGNWTPDGRYYLFQSLRNGKTNLWALRDNRSRLEPHPVPVQLTNGPLNFCCAVASRDGKKIFAIGDQARAELLRYDGRSAFSSYLGGISARDVAFSSDGQWMTYVSVPDSALWRSKLDGSQRLQLTETSWQAGLPRWSPDGKQILFMGRTANTGWRAFLISSAGGAPRDLVPSAPVAYDPNWSPDGKAIVLTLNEAGSPGASPSGPGIAIFDLTNEKLSPLPSAAQLFSPRWSPDGRYIAAITDDSEKLRLFDRATKQWTDLVNMPIGYPSWSHDGQYLYFDTTLTDDPAFFRVRIADHRVERLVSLKDLQRYWGDFGPWTGLAPDDSLLVVRDIGSQDIYALDWKVP